VAVPRVDTFVDDWKNSPKRCAGQARPEMDGRSRHHFARVIRAGLKSAREGAGSRSPRSSPRRDRVGAVKKKLLFECSHCLPWYQAQEGPIPQIKAKMLRGGKEASLLSAGKKVEVNAAITMAWSIFPCRINRGISDTE